MHLGFIHTHLSPEDRMQLAVVVGNPKRASRTLGVAQAVADRVRAGRHVEHIVTVDLAEYGHRLFEWPDEHLSELNEAVASSDVLVIATPTYKGAYTGLLKAFLDRYPSQGLAGVTAIPIMTADSPTHAMAIDMTLRPLLVELGASVPTAGLFFLMSQMAELDRLVGEWASANLVRPGILGAVVRAEAALDPAFLSTRRPEVRTL
jgi:FMN reductase